MELKLTEDDVATFGTRKFLYDVEIFEGQFVVHVRDKKTNKYIFDKTFDEIALDFI